MKRFGLGLEYGIKGCVYSLVVFMLLENILRATDVQGFILVGTITLSATICFCTGMIIDNYKAGKIK